MRANATFELAVYCEMPFLSLLPVGLGYRQTQTKGHPRSLSGKCEVSRRFQIRDRQHVLANAAVYADPHHM